MSDKKQRTLFNNPEWWEEHWQDMPEYKQNRLESIRELKINFRNQEDLENFGKLIEQKIYPTYNTYWYPKLNIKTYSNKKYIDES